MDRDLRTIQRMLETFSEHFDIERDDRSKPYGFRWQEASRGMAVSHLTPQESLLLQLAQEHLRNLLPRASCSPCRAFLTRRGATSTATRTTPVHLPGT